MGIDAYNRSIGVITGDFFKIISSLTKNGIINLEKLNKKKLIKIFSNKRLWIWDMFNFDTMTVEEAYY